MSEADALEAVAIYAANVTNSFLGFVSITLAYLTVAYLVGRSLSKFQTIAVSGLYLAASIPIAVSCVISAQAWAAIMSSESTVLDTLTLYTRGYWDIYMAILVVAIFAISLYFMIDVRRKVHENDT